MLKRLAYSIAIAGLSWIIGKVFSIAKEIVLEYLIEKPIEAYDIEIYNGEYRNVPNVYDELKYAEKEKS